MAIPLTDEQTREIWGLQSEGFTRAQICELTSRSYGAVDRAIKRKPIPKNSPVDSTPEESPTLPASSSVNPNGSFYVTSDTPLSEVFKAIAHQFRLMSDMAEQHAKEALLIETNQDAFKGIDRLKISLREATEEKTKLRDQLIRQASVVYSD